MTDNRFRRCEHVRRGDDFRRAYRRRCSASDAQVIVYGCENNLDHCRLGLSVSKRYGSAVARNRWKRLVREAFRACHAQLPPGIDLIVLPREKLEPTFDQLLASLSRLARQVGNRLRKKSISARPPARDKP
jgi:ribonuclease P protein component